MLICSQCSAVLGIHSTACPVDGGVPKVLDQIPPGAVLGGYRVNKMLGEGGMGFVYEATHEVLGRQCALKVLRPEFATDKSVVTRFLLEAKAVNVINHQHIVSVYDYGDDIEGIVYFVMEYLQGQTLAAFMGRHAPMPPALLLHVFTQILQGLAAAHKKQIVHRDLKFENIFVIARAGNPVFVKILDFGIAKLRGDGAVEGLTGAGSLIGTPEFMSPEQFRGQPVDARSDIFSLGIMMYAAATGRMPFKGEDMSFLALGIIKETPPKITERMPGFPPALCAFIERALEKQPADRFADAGVMLTELGAVQALVDGDRSHIISILRKELGDANADIEPVFEPTWVAKQERKASAPAPTTRGAGAAPGKALLFGGAALALLAAGGIAFALMRDSPSSSETPRQVSDEPTAATEAASADLATLARQDRLVELRSQALAQMNQIWASADAGSREQLTDALVRVGSSASEALLIRALEDSPQTVVLAAQGLGELGSASARGPIYQAFERSSAQLQTDLAAVLIALGDERAVPILERSLTQPRSKFVAALALSVHGRASARTLTILRNVFAETPPFKGHWLEAADGLLTSKDAAAETALLGAVASDDAPANRVAAAIVLASHDNATGLDYLSSVVADARSELRADAGLALAKNSNADAGLYVPVGLMSDSSAAQITAIAILARLGGSDLSKQTNRLVALAESDAAAAVKMAALAALTSLPDQSPHEDMQVQANERR